MGTENLKKPTKIVSTSGGITGNLYFAFNFLCFPNFEHALLI